MCTLSVVKSCLTSIILRSMLLKDTLHNYNLYDEDEVCGWEYFWMQFLCNTGFFCTTCMGRVRSSTRDTAVSTAQKWSLSKSDRAFQAPSLPTSTIIRHLQQFAVVVE